MKYTNPTENEWVQPKRKGYRLMCCDCGLVHELDFRLYGANNNHIQFRARRNNRATASARKGMDLKHKKK